MELNFLLSFKHEIKEREVNEFGEEDLIDMMGGVMILMREKISESKCCNGRGRE